ncbi:MAG: DUF417 family protein [Actinomycetota bacterium]|nr:DUF417 family protein [Actinomycetota bacterium]
MTIRHARERGIAQTISTLGGVLLRIGLVIPLAWIGLQKFTAAEAEAIAPLISHHPLMSWLYDIVGVQALSNSLGAVEIVAAVLIAVKPLSATWSAIGSAMAALIFLSTVSFLVTTPDVVAGSELGIPFLTATGGFLIKDIALLGATIWTLGDSLSARSRRNVPARSLDAAMV